jgi:hypothetical protein
MVYFVIQLKTRAVEVAEIRVDPNGEWMKQMARNLVDPVEGKTRGWRPRALLPLCSSFHGGPPSHSCWHRGGVAVMHRRHNARQDLLLSPNESAQM